MINYLIIVSELIGVILYPLGQLGRISFANQQVSVYPYELAMAVTLLILLIKYRFTALIRSSFRKLLCLFFGSLAVSFVLTASSYSFYDNAVGLLYFLRLVFYTVHFIYLGYHAVHIKTFKRFINRELFATVFIIALTSVVQYFFFPNLRPLLYQGWDPHLYRIFSFFYEPYLAGAALGLSFLFIYFRWQAAGKARYLKAAALFFLFVLIMLTFSRTVYLASFLTVCLILLRGRKPILIAVLLLLFTVLALVIPKPEGVGVQLFRTFSIEARLLDAKQGIEVWEKEPLFGVGYNRIRYRKAELGLAAEYGSSHAASNYHSSFITILAAGGLIGLILYGIFIGSLMKISQAGFYYLMFLSVISLGDNALLHPFMMFLYYRLLIIE